ncbi:MAG: lytic transglycosylase domain-containing protein [Woeseiaceae bacterium]|nr:lytic transglycosylase domain-containing protein [Woeseiaceae bacterium]
MTTAFPVPEELEPDVGFWLAVFTDYSTDEGVLHDNRYLGVVYERVTMPADTGRRERQRRISERREHYQEILKTLAYGKRDGLSDEEQRVLGLWPADVSNKELAAAAGRIRYQQGLAERFRDGLQRAGRWRSHINQSLKRHGVPLELAALPHVESSYNPLALSHVGASGIWQFTRGTGRRFMRVDHVLDERNDPFAASEAAAELLAYNYSIIGNWPMAITAYNHGLAGVRRAMREFGDAGFERILREYRGRTFGFASRNFYVAFVAAMRVDTNPDKYFPGVVPEEPVAYERHTLPSYIAANDLASALRISLNEFASHNPPPGHNLAGQQVPAEGIRSAVAGRPPVGTHGDTACGYRRRVVVQQPVAGHVPYRCPWRHIVGHSADVQYRRIYTGCVEQSRQREPDSCRSTAPLTSGRTGAGCARGR